MVKLLQDLEALFQMEVGESATVLKRILGDVVAEPSDTKSKHGKAWLLRFTINGAALMAETNRFRDYPTKDTWEYLSDTGWIMPGIKETVVEVSEKFLNRHDRKRALELKDTGDNITQIAEIRVLAPDQWHRPSLSTCAPLRRKVQRLAWHSRNQFGYFVMRQEADSWRVAPYSVVRGSSVLVMLCH